MPRQVCRFTANLPAIQSAVTVSGDGNGARVKLDVPESELSEALKLMLLRGQTFLVTVEVADDAEKAS